MRSRSSRSAFWIVECSRDRRAHQGGRTIGDRGSELEPLVRAEQTINIVGRLGAERRAERHDVSGERSHRAGIVLRGSAAVNLSAELTANGDCS